LKICATYADFRGSIVVGPGSEALAALNLCLRALEWLWFMEGFQFVSSRSNENE
jgi:hypothetical protein